MANIIRSVMTSFGAVGPGFSIEDPEVDHMYEAYTKLGHAYYVLENEEGSVVGGCGIGPLVGEKSYCELKKMYYLPEYRGKGLGMKMMQRCMGFAEGAGYTHCYIETLSGMDGAESLYQKADFNRISTSLGNTGHGGCDKFYLRKLQ